jgi:glycosyltransferase involved in cell wall biosynthesis
MQGYSASCLQHLRRIDGVHLHVVYLKFDESRLEDDLLAGIPNTRLLESDANDHIGALVEGERPDIVFLCGWFYGPYRNLARAPGLQSAAFVLGMDTPWTGSWWQHLNRIRLSGFVRRMDRVIVAGEKSREFALQLGVTPAKIHSGFYGFDFTAFALEGERARTRERPLRRFLFAGRYVPEKGLGLLIEAYRAYRRAVTNPWPLDVCGAGVEAWRFLSEPGVTDLGYVQPSSLPQVFADHDVFVLPSVREPWGVALVEAAATGLPLICTDACGAAEQVLRANGNGILIPAGDTAALADALTWMHEHPDALPGMGEQSKTLAQQHSSAAWADRMHDVFMRVVAERAAAG